MRFRLDSMPEDRFSVSSGARHSVRMSADDASPELAELLASRELFKKKSLLKKLGGIAKIAAPILLPAVGTKVLGRIGGQVGALVGAGARAALTKGGSKEKVKAGAQGLAIGEASALLSSEVLRLQGAGATGNPVDSGSNRSETGSVTAPGSNPLAGFSLSPMTIGLLAVLLFLMLRK